LGWWFSNPTDEKILPIWSLLIGKCEALLPKAKGEMLPTLKTKNPTTP
jgi:hypothetical protein